VVTRFHGWPEQAHKVLLELEGEPTRETREQVRRDRERYVRLPMIDLLNDLADTDAWYEDFSVWRYGSTAYWWQNQCGVARMAGSVYIGFRFNLDSLRIMAEWSYPNPGQIASFRAAVAADESGRALEGLLSSLAADGHEIRGDVMKRIPRGYAADHPRADLLKHRSLLAARELESDTVRDVEPVYRACERLRPLLGWLAERTVATQQAEAAGSRSGQPG
jgi:hypothetical protein